MYLRENSYVDRRGGIPSSCVYSRRVRTAVGRTRSVCRNSERPSLGAHAPMLAPVPAPCPGWHQLLFEPAVRVYCTTHILLRTSMYLASPCTPLRGRAVFNVAKRAQTTYIHTYTLLNIVCCMLSTNVSLPSNVVVSGGGCSVQR